MYCHICFYLFTTCFDLSRGHHQVFTSYKTCGITNMNSYCLQVDVLRMFCLLILLEPYGEVIKMLILKLSWWYILLFCPVLVGPIYASQSGVEGFSWLPNNVAVFITDAPAKRVPTICQFAKSDKSLIFRFFHTDCPSTQPLMQWYERYRMETNGGRIFNIASWSSFNVVDTYLVHQFLSFSTILYMYVLYLATLSITEYILVLVNNEWKESESKRSWFRLNY
jgi:hypothetical protein